MLTIDNYLKCSYKGEFQESSYMLSEGLMGFFSDKGTAELSWEVKGAVCVFVLVLNWTCW